MPRFELPAWVPRIPPLWFWVIFGVAFVGLAALFARPFYLSPPPVDAEVTPETATALPLEHYADIDACVRDGHANAACGKALGMVQQYTVSQMPLYRTLSICQGHWKMCVTIDTGPPPNQPTAPHVIIAAPPVRGFGVFWKGDTPLQAAPLYERTDGRLAEGRDDTRTGEDLDGD